MNRSPFLILGLPRSRTYWLANLFCTRETFCFHDLSAHTRDVDEMAEALCRPEVRVCGSSDSGQVLCLGKLLPRLPRDTRFVFVHRPFESAVYAYARALGLDAREPSFREAMERVRELLEYWRRHLPHLEVEYEELEDEAVVRGLWEYATRGEAFPEEHYGRIRGERLTIPDEQLRAALKTPRPCAAVAG